MNYIFNNGKIALAVANNEYHLGKQAKDAEGNDILQNKRYYYRIDLAVKSLARHLADLGEPTDLWEWLAIYTEVCENVSKELKETD